jgi:hypothetical protein
MAITTSAFVLGPGGSGFMNPGLAYGDVKDPEDLVNLGEQIPYIAACGIRGNALASRGNSWPHPPKIEARERHPRDAATDVPSPEDVEAEDLVEKERYESFEPGDFYRRRSPTSFLELGGNLSYRLREGCTSLEPG